jgi:hypothetical protein
LPDEMDTLPLERIVRHLEQRMGQRSIIDLEQTYGPNSPEVAMLLTELIKKLGAQKGNEKFVETLEIRVNKIRALLKNCDPRI